MALNQEDERRAYRMYNSLPFEVAQAIRDLRTWVQMKEAGQDESADGQLGLVRASAAVMLEWEEKELQRADAALAAEKTRRVHKAKPGSKPLLRVVRDGDKR